MEIKVKEFFGTCFYYQYLWGKEGLHGGSDGKESACNAEDLGSIPGSGRSYKTETELMAAWEENEGKG